MVRDVERRELVVELIRAGRILGEAGIAQLRGRRRVRVLVVGLAEDMFVAAQATPRQVWDGISMMRHAPMVQAQPVVPIGELVAAHTRLPNSVNMSRFESSKVHVN